ncbi:glycosyltransferase family 4 protein [Shewanella sp. S1-58-MNA-CIBAN-0166]|uniref:glycosyltransferase family 4 protein n=1 Tax=Shewanella sp. S1-58-MNA-CIBAN-0166 TaxID=3140467 RepID=UPI00332A0AF3
MTNLKVLHIVTDYPDHTNYNHTKAVKNLLVATQNEIKHEVIALRRLKKAKIVYERFNEYIYFQTPSFPFGFFHISTSFLYAVILSNILRKECIQFDIIHAHKLTIDGLVAFFLSKITGVKYVLSIRADTDLKFINNKPFSRWLFRKVYKNANHIFWVSAWAKNTINSKLKYKAVNESNLANIVTAKSSSYEFLDKKIVISNRFIFVGRLESAEKKGLLDLIKVMRFYPKLSLDIYGPSTSLINEKILKYIKDNNVETQINLMGSLSKEELISKYKSYSALLMPSQNETFGMVYAEALLNCLPILCCEKSGIDGYLEGSQYFKKVTFGDLEGIKKCIQQFDENQYKIKSQLINDRINGLLDIFETNNIKKNYISRLENAQENI